MAVSASPRPAARPEQVAGETVAAADQAVAAMADDIAGALAEATAEPTPDSLEAQAVEIADAAPVAEGQLAAEATQIAALAASASDPLQQVASAAEAPQTLTIKAAAANPQPVKLVASPRPPKQMAPIYDNVVVAAAEVAEPTEEVVTTISSSGGNGYGINVGRFNSHGEAERVLMKTLLIENATLANSLRKIVQKSGGFDANFLGLTQKEADLACRRLQARGVQCFTMGS
ncbi:MAG: D-alanyl-D-alanine carboxypeptidase [Rhodobacteraceae bacterium]|nr:MAG: D-alanyl-D-alanine carboxypeptidase [Paracoccaceae bacterium]